MGVMVSIGEALVPVEVGPGEPNGRTAGSSHTIQGVVSREPAATVSVGERERAGSWYGVRLCWSRWCRGRNRQVCDKPDPVKNGFPILTLATNVLGAVLIGFVAGLATERKDVSANALLFWKTGVCGGITTFSTFSLEAFSLFENHQYGVGGTYILVSVAFCLIGILCGKRVATLIG